MWRIYGFFRRRWRGIELTGVKSAMALEHELATYERNLATLMEHTGKYVLIHGEDVVDFFAAYEDAIKGGYQRFKLEPFLVKQISATQAVQHITRPVLPYSEKAEAAR